jgi:dihydrofolate synthase/folylpolyglutamate synthase
MQRLRPGPLVEARREAELWLDGGHNPACGARPRGAAGGCPQRPTHLICGMLNTKDVAGYMRPFRRLAESLTRGVDPRETATLPAAETAAAARPLAEIAAGDPHARILICGSLYLAGEVLRENG